MKWIQRAAGAIVGSAVGDALGGPFEFGPQGAFSARFPAPGAGDEMCGGGGWDPGEATDDTQMAVLVGESLLERGGLDLPDIFARFQRWAASDPKDIGLQTEDVLTNGMPWDLAAASHRSCQLLPEKVASQVRIARAPVSRYQRVLTLAPRYGGSWSAASTSSADLHVIGHRVPAGRAGNRARACSRGPPAAWGTGSRSPGPATGVPVRCRTRAVTKILRTGR